MTSDWLAFSFGGGAKVGAAGLFQGAAVAQWVLNGTFELSAGAVPATISSSDVTGAAQFRAGSIPSRSEQNPQLKLRIWADNENSVLTILEHGVAAAGVLSQFELITAPSTVIQDGALEEVPLETSCAKPGDFDFYAADVGSALMPLPLEGGKAEGDDISIKKVFLKRSIPPLGQLLSHTAAELAGQIVSLPRLDDDTGCICTSPGLVKVGDLCAQTDTGSVANGDTLSFCPPGTYNDDTGASGSTDAACTACPAGTYNPLSGQSSPSCAFCPSGTEQPNTGAVSIAACNRCAPGSFGGSLGLQACEVCAQGSYSAASGEAKCTLCPAGMYGKRTGATSEITGCAACPAGSFTAGSGTATEAGCIVGAASVCPSGQDRSITSGQCEAIACNDPLILDTASSQCVGCGPGSAYNGSSCSACGEGQLCPGGTSHAVVGSAALAASSPEAANIASKQADLVPVPSSSLLAQVTLLIVTLALAIAIPLLVASCVSAAPERVRELYRSLDMFGLDHKQHEGTSKILKRTPLGSALTLSMVVLALSISTLIDFVEDNFLVNSTLQPTPNNISGIGGMRTDSAGIFITTGVTVHLRRMCLW